MKEEGRGKGVGGEKEGGRAIFFFCEPSLKLNFDLEVRKASRSSDVHHRRSLAGRRKEGRGERKRGKKGGDKSPITSKSFSIQLN